MSAVFRNLPAAVWMYVNANFTARIIMHYYRARPALFEFKSNEIKSSFVQEKKTKEKDIKLELCLETGHKRRNNNAFSNSVKYIYIMNMHN